MGVRQSLRCVSVGLVGLAACYVSEGGRRPGDVPPPPPACLLVSPFIDADPKRAPDGYVLATLEWTFSDPKTGSICVFDEQRCPVRVTPVELIEGAAVDPFADAWRAPDVGRSLSKATLVLVATSTEPDSRGLWAVAAHSADEGRATLEQLKLGLCPALPQPPPDECDDCVGSPFAGACTATRMISCGPDDQATCGLEDPCPPECCGLWDRTKEPR